jgi:hypothetical protein
VAPGTAELTAGHMQRSERLTRCPLNERTCSGHQIGPYTLKYGGERRKARDINTQANVCAECDQARRNGPSPTSTAKSHSWSKSLRSSDDSTESGTPTASRSRVTTLKICRPSSSVNAPSVEARRLNLTIDQSSWDGLTPEDCAAISRFRGRGGGLLVTRDHMDLGSSVCALGGVGKAHYFHSRNLDPDSSNHVADDPYSTHISWPNFHSGANGDFQEIEVIGDVHPVLSNSNSPTGVIRFLPSHPHEGAVGAPSDELSRVIACGRSKATGRRFNIAVAFEPGVAGGPAIAQSTFHHFADYNWDTRSGCASFVDEPPGDAMQRTAEAIADTRRYVSNVAHWLAGRLV